MSGADIAVTVAGGRWRQVLPEAEAIGRRAAAAALAEPGAARAEGVPAPAELAVVLGDDALLHRLNRKYRHINRPTNVLSFAAFAAGEPRPPGPAPLGDVFVAFETVAAEAAQQDKTLAAHLSHLVVHGVLHLLGHDHEVAAEAEAMEALERSVLGRLGFADPYAPAPKEAAR